MTTQLPGLDRMYLAGPIGQKHNPILEEQIEALAQRQYSACVSSQPQVDLLQLLPTNAPGATSTASTSGTKVDPDAEDQARLRERGTTFVQPWTRIDQSAAKFSAELRAEVASERGRTQSFRDLAEHLHGLIQKPQQPSVPKLTLLEVEGRRDFPNGLPTHESLYWGEARPAALPEVMPIHKCVLCDKVKSRPVCWGCPECGRTMHTAPCRDYELEEEIKAKYPTWVDRSICSDGFYDFTFPRRSVDGRPLRLRIDSDQPSRDSARTELRPRTELRLGLLTRTPICFDIRSAPRPSRHSGKGCLMRGIDPGTPANSHCRCLDAFRVAERMPAPHVFSLNSHGRPHEQQWIGWEKQGIAHNAVRDGLDASRRAMSDRPDDWTRRWGGGWVDEREEQSGRTTPVNTAARCRLESRLEWVLYTGHLERAACETKTIVGLPVNPAASSTTTANSTHGRICLDSATRLTHINSGRTVRRERVRGKRKIAKKHISRLTLPDAVEDWACAELRQEYEVFTAALYLQDEFDEKEFLHWLHPPPFDAQAVTLVEDPTEYDDHSNYWATCAVDGCLLRRERQAETQLKEQLSTLSKRKRDDYLRVEVKGLLERDWPAMRQKSSLYEPECFIYDFFKTNVSITRSLQLEWTRLLSHGQPHLSYSLLQRATDGLPMLRQKALSPDPELPVGDAHSILNSRRDEHLRASLLRRIEGVVKHNNQKYLVIVPIEQSALEQDFEQFIGTLRAIERKYEIGLSKRTESYVSADSSYESPGLVYVHLTAATITMPANKQTLHACSLGEDWLQPLGSNTEVLAVGAVVFCVGYLLRIRRLELEMRNQAQIHDTHWVFRASFIARFHLRSEEHHRSSPDVDFFLMSGVLPGRVISSQDDLPVMGYND
ncbi:hypothetical protein C8F01DRAFT_1076452 [Mycena amicta]|nr:hypothetical protein C8F01DRAFT_1076452 [Mycena amicta]